MTAVELVNETYTYVQLLFSLEEQEQVFLKTKEEHAAVFRKIVSLRYDTITLILDVVIAAGAKPETSRYLECTIDVGKQKVGIDRVYCQHKKREPHILNYIQHHTPERFPSGNHPAHTPEIRDYITIADTIAKEAYLYSSGDDYRPGNFSEIMVDDDIITLRQINRHNSRSIDHKDNYTMRDLEFLIPLNTVILKPSFEDECIGNMVIRFSDRSSTKNKQAGDQIRKKIDDAKLKFETEVDGR
jgi:hypothetical protein